MKEFLELQRRKSYALVMSWHPVTCTITTRWPRWTKDKILPTIQDNGPIVLTWEGLKLEFLSYYFTGSKLYTSKWWWSYSAWNILQGSYSLGGQGCVGIRIFTGLLNVTFSRHCFCLYHSHWSLCKISRWQKLINKLCIIVIVVG